MADMSENDSLSSLSAADSVPHRRQKLARGTTSREKLQVIRRAAQKRRNDLMRARKAKQGEPLCLTMLIDDITQALGEQPRTEGGEFASHASGSHN